MVGTAVWEVGKDGLLRRNWVKRNALRYMAGLPGFGLTFRISPFRKQVP